MLECILKLFRRGYLPFALVLPGGLIVPDASAAPPDGYYLVWADEFSASSLDLAKWGAWVGPNRDAQNVADAVSVGGGYLTITTYTANGTHYSGIISSEGRFRADYGYYESSLEFNGSPGMFSGFWLNSPTTGRYVGDPSASGDEIDICEHRKTDAGNADDINNVVQTTVHWDGYAADHKSVTSGNIGSGLGTGFHTYGFLWQHTNYSFTIDGTPQWSTAAALSDRTEVITLSSEVWSNSFAGIVPPGGYGDLLSSTTTLVVDYVRYYAPTSTVFWTGASSADWTTAGNWLSNMIPNAASDAVFSYLSVGNFSISLGQDTAVRGLSIQEAGPISITGSTLTLNSGGIDMVSGFNMSPAFNDATINSALVLGAAQCWNIGEGRVLTVNGVVGGAANLTLNGRGTVVLGGTNSCSGLTTISNGTLLVNGMITNPVTVAGGTLSGTGTIAAPVLVSSGGTLSPGPSIGTLTISNTLTLQPGSLTSLDLNKTTGARDQIIGLSSVSYDGTLALNNLAGTLAVGAAFKLFDAGSYSGAFANITPSSPGTRLGWDASTLITDGTLRLKLVPLIQTTNVLESRIGNSTSGANNPAFSFTGFSSTISATKSLAKGCTSPGSSRFSSTAATSTSFSVTPTLVPGITYTVAITWGHNSSPYQESANIVVRPTATGMSSTTFPSTTTAFESSANDANNSTWVTVGNITPNTSTPTVTFTYASGMTSGRFYADAVRFVSQIPIPNSISASCSGNSVILNWSGNFLLQDATNVLGPYTNLPGPVLTGPYTNVISGNQQYFRLAQ
jgi:autotransporter-associated beta strand protein